MKKLITALLLVAAHSLAATAQTPYYLPHTELRFTVTVEKTTYTPGEYAAYAEKYLRITGIDTRPSTNYRIVDIKVSSVGERDTTKSYVAPNDAKHNILRVALDESGTLLAINDEPKTVAVAEPFRPAKKPAPLNPRDYMTEEILSAGSAAKMAELCALEIYDTRESKNLLNKGQADFMPKDGEQLRLMLRNLDTQEAALTQLFTGTIVKDTTEAVIEYVPRPEATARQLLFRFSKWNGMADADDLAGVPYYITVEDKHLTAQIQEQLLNVKKVKDNSGIYVNVPGKIKVTLSDGSRELNAYELYAAQFGRTEMLDDELFGKKLATSLVLNPVTGSIESVTTEMVKK